MKSWRLTARFTILPKNKSGSPRSNGLKCTQESNVSTTSIKTEAQRMVDQLPADATWDDLLYQVYVRQSIEAGLEDVREGRVISTEELRRRLGLNR